MKNLLKSIFALLSLFMVEYCNAQEIKPMKTEKKILVVYYSWSGNTRNMAKQIQKTFKADLFEIVPATPYPKVYNDILDQAKKEINSNFKPKLKANITDLDKYEVIFIGSPNWWSTIAPPVATFLDSNDFKDKIVIPFFTHGGGGMAACEKDVIKLCPKSTHLKALALKGSSVKSSRSTINKWLEETMSAIKQQ